jgi:hypothetical protein
MAARISENEAEEIPCLVVLRVQLDRALEMAERNFHEATVVGDLPEVEIHERALGIGR